MSKKQSVNSIEEVIKKRRRSLATRKGYVSLVIRILLLAAAAYVLFTQVFLITQANGNDMFPAIKDGDLIIGFRLQNEFAKDDVVVYRIDNKTYIGRIVAGSNDVVTLDDSGTLLVNGTIQRGEIVYPTLAKEGLDYPLRVDEGSIFVLGDHRMEAKDSRDFGPIPLEQVEGKIISILRRRGL